MTITLEVADRIAVMTLNRPPVNALDRDHQRQLAALAREVSHREDVRAVILTGSGAGFSAGADIAEMYNLPWEEMQAHAPILQQCFGAVADIPMPVCAAIEGYALGGGLELALTADFVVVAETARLGLPEIKIGVTPAAGGTQRLSRRVGVGTARRMILTGEEVTGRDAVAIGLVDRSVPPGGAVEAARDLLAPFVTGPRHALAAAKRAINAAYGVRGFEVETRAFADLFPTADQAEGMRAFLERRKPQFQ